MEYIDNVIKNSRVFVIYLALNIPTIIISLGGASWRRLMRSANKM